MLGGLGGLDAAHDRDHAAGAERGDEAGVRRVWGGQIQFGFHVGFLLLGFVSGSVQRIRSGFDSSAHRRAFSAA
jgi:hypothetical protein